MKLIFNDATEIIVQQVESHGDYLRILTVGITPEQLKVLFTDSSRTSRMIVQERGQTIATYKGYTAYDHAEIYTGQIYGVVLYKEGTTTEERLTNVEDTVNQTNTDLQMAIAELTTVIATLATSAAGTPQNIEGVKQMFNENSVIVKTWVSLVLAGTYTREQIPGLSNLRDVVYQVLDGTKGE